MPTFQEVEKAALENHPFMLIPDNNVCIHISEFNTSKDKSKKEKAINFMKYLHESNISILPAYGLIERASKPGTLELNQEKFIYFEDVFLQMVGHNRNNDRVSSIISVAEPLKALIYPLHAYLLKIKLILLEREASKNNSKKNIHDLYTFMSDLGIILALPWQFAVALFGGKTELNKFMRPKKGDSVKGIWSATWDLFYIQQIHQYYGIREQGKGYFPRYILVTDDNACSTIADLMKVSSAFDYGNTIYNAVTISHDFPHWNASSNYLSEISVKLYSEMHKRSVERVSMSESERQVDIKRIIDAAEIFILEATKKIQLFEKKGFG